MTSPMFELQAALAKRLKNDALLKGLINGRVFDRVPAQAEFPYISFGPSDETSADADCINAFEISFQIDCWSRAVGFQEARKIADAVRQALKPDLVLAINALVYLEHRQTRTIRDPDGLTSHAALTFEAVAEQH